MRLTGAKGEDMQGDDVSPLDEAGPALFQLGRIFARQPTGRMLVGDSARTVNVSRILVAQAVAAGPEEPGGNVTVGLVADRLGIDPSTASRLTAEALQAGYLSRVASQVDGRRVQLALTEAGRALLADAYRYQRAVFARVTRDWPDGDRYEFARLLPRFVDAVASVQAAPTDDTPTLADGWRSPEV